MNLIGSFRDLADKLRLLVLNTDKSEVVGQVAVTQEEQGALKFASRELWRSLLVRPELKRR